jgi:hypothetical protein
LYRLTLQNSSSQRWHEVTDAVAREKVGQHIRETLAKNNPMKCEARKVQRKSKAKRTRHISATSTAILSSSSTVSMSSSATSLSSVGEEMNCSGTTDWGNNDAIDTDDTTPLQVDFSTLNSNSHNSISISPPPSPLPQKGPIAFLQSGKFLHKDMHISQPIPDWHNQQELLVWNYGEV